LIVSLSIVKAGVATIVLLNCLSLAEACHRRCQVNSACLPYCSGLSSVNPVNPVSPDEEDFGRDLPKPGPLPDIPKVPPLNKIGASESLSNRTVAEILILTPEGAKVFIDGSPTQQTQSERLFVTPPLTVGQEYQYEVLVVWEKDGTIVRETRQVKVRSGEVTRVGFFGFGETEVARREVKTTSSTVSAAAR
jgi:uncharacterized protein (TIGR03000 family)